MLDTSIKVKTDHFDGPLGLLLLLIQKEEMSIRNLNLTKITQQYLDYLDEMKDLNFDIAGEYLYLASTLIFLKSKSALSEEDSIALADLSSSSNGLEIRTQSDLVRRLEQLKHYQEMSQKLWALPKKGHETFTRPKIGRAKIVNSILVPMDLEKMTTVMIDFLKKEKKKFAVVKKENLSIKQKLLSLKNILVKGETLRMEELFNQGEKLKSIDFVITFISLLELARLRKVNLFQHEPLGQIYVEVIEFLKDFNVENATGFEQESETEEQPVVDNKEQKNMELLH
ncbi:MAG: ScpA family protein [Bdellovibrionota bacterium]|nr:ScpA family protein [Bdellovibrionota bacterium]